MATHLPLLAAVVASTRGPVIELGMGDYSTPLLHLLCRDRLLISADADEQWIRRFEQFRSANHLLHLVGDWSRFAAVDDQAWDVAFVDCSPSTARVGLIERLRGRTRHIVVHDTETDTEAAGVYAVDGVLGRFRYRSDYQIVRPHTTVVSDVEPFPLTDAEAGAR